MRRVEGSVVAITGAGSGIGRALALELARRGAALSLSDWRADDVDETVRACKDLGADARGYQVDVRDAAAVQTWADSTVADFGRVNAIVNNAGVALTGDVLDMSLADIAWVVDIDFWGVVHGTKAFLPHLIDSGDGHVVNLSSVFGLVAVPSQSAYNAAKFAVRGFTEALRQEMRQAGHPVAVTAVHPGGIRTNVVRNSRTVGDVEHAELVTLFERRLARTSPETAARAIVRGLESGRARVLIGPDAYAIDTMARVLGPAYQRVVTAASSRVARARTRARSQVRTTR